ncbi:MAG: ABC transporter substrate-binding protein [Chloroflexota bacterium]|nr:ABC transporter substrate-binding protein [Chloroflexota bacterium]
MRGLFALAVSAALLAAACGGAANAPAAPSASAAPSPVATTKASAAPASFDLRVSYSNLIADELPLWATNEGGFFKQEGLNVGGLQQIDSSTGIAALLSGKVDIAQLGGSETMSANAQAGGAGPLVVIGQLAGVYPFVLEVSKDIKTAADLKGKSIGVSSIGSSSDIATRVALRKLGLDPDKDVHIQAVGSTSSRISALLGGAIQGGVAQPPDTIKLEAGGFHVVYDLASQGLPSANTSVVTTRAFLQAHKDVVQRYVDAIVLGTKKLKADKAFGISVLEKYLKSTDQNAMGVTYDFYAGKVTKSQPFSKPDMFADAQQVLGAKDAKVKAYDVTQMLDSEFVQSAVDRGLDK